MTRRSLIVAAVAACLAATPAVVVAAPSDDPTELAEKRWRDYVRPRCGTGRFVKCLNLHTWCYRWMPGEDRFRCTAEWINYGWRTENCDADGWVQPNSRGRFTVRRYVESCAS